MSSHSGRRRSRKRSRRAMSAGQTPLNETTPFAFPPVNLDLSECSPINSEDMTNSRSESKSELQEPPKKKLRRSLRTIVRRKDSNSTVLVSDDENESSFSFRVRVRPLPLCTIEDGITPYEIVALEKDDEKSASQSDVYEKEWVGKSTLHHTYHEMCNYGVELVPFDESSNTSCPPVNPIPNGIIIPKKKTGARRRRRSGPKQTKKRPPPPRPPKSEFTFCTRSASPSSSLRRRAKLRSKKSSTTKFCDEYCGLGLATRLTPVQHSNIDFPFRSCQLYGLVLPYKNSLRMVHVWIPPNTKSCLSSNDSGGGSIRTEYDSHVVWIRGLCVREEEPLDEKDGRLPVGAVDMNRARCHNSTVSIRHTLSVPVWCFTPEHSTVSVEKIDPSSDLHEKFMSYFRSTCQNVFDESTSPSRSDAKMEEDSVAPRRGRRRPPRKRRKTTPSPSSSPNEDEDSSIYSNQSVAVTVVPTHTTCSVADIRKRCRTIDISDDEDLSDDAFDERHQPHESQERDHLRGGDDATRTWSVCSACGKWRLLPWNHRREISGGSWYCGGSRQKPRPAKCDELDHWLLFCVGHESTVRLNRLGIKTVESLIPGSNLLKLLHQNGFYLTETDKRIVKLGS